MDKETLEKIRKTLEDKEKELDSKFYLIPGKEEIAKKFDYLLKEKASFKGRECVGIIELRKQINKYLTGKPGIEFMVDGTALQAFSHFMEKIEGKGADEAEEAYTLFQAINQAMATLKEDIDAYNILAQEYQNAEVELAKEEDKKESKEESKEK